MKAIRIPKFGDGESINNTNLMGCATSCEPVASQQKMCLFEKKEPKS